MSVKNDDWLTIMASEERSRMKILAALPFWPQYIWPIVPSWRIELDFFLFLFGDLFWPLSLFLHLSCRVIICKFFSQRHLLHLKHAQLCWFLLLWMLLIHWNDSRVFVCISSDVTNSHHWKSCSYLDSIIHFVTIPIIVSVRFDSRASEFRSFWALKLMILPFHNF